MPNRTIYISEGNLTAWEVFKLRYGNINSWLTLNAKELGDRYVAPSVHPTSGLVTIGDDIKTSISSETTVTEEPTYEPLDSPILTGGVFTPPFPKKPLRIKSPAIRDEIKEDFHCPHGYSWSTCPKVKCIKVARNKGLV